MQPALQFEPTLDPPTCLGCGYRLEGLTEPRCPECGKAFDPTDPRTYTSSAWGWRQRLAGGLITWGIGSGIWLIAVGPYPLVIPLLGLPTAIVMMVGFRCQIFKTLAWIAMFLVGGAVVITWPSQYWADVIEGVIKAVFAVGAIAIVLGAGRFIARCISGWPRPFRKFTAKSF